MVSVVVAYIFHAEVIHNEREIYWAGYMSRGMTYFIIFVRTELVSKVFVC